MKQEFTIDISEGAKSALEALQILTDLDPNEGFHASNDLRPPLGIYNTSISRICDKLTKCCIKLEAYFKSSIKVDDLRRKDELREEVIDYLELALYAAAEHVDDVALIAKGFFPDKKKYKSSKPARQLENTVKKHKGLISASINAIKHHQARLRLYSLEILHGDTPHCLHGYFIEGVHDGVVGPNKIFHDNQRQVFSITSLMWEILCFVLNASRQLKTFLEVVTTSKPNESLKCNGVFTKAVIAAARLPLYSFDEIHPFSETRVIVMCSDGKNSLLDSRIYGSITNKWTSSDKMAFFQNSCGYAGDGVTKSFRMVKPIAVRLQHWT
ncbi:hypothetical protein [Candidatus Nitronereus thalassa]|uniref:Uncharacterized protein n=1 Tax=Candidatus Nitronereus thalassa TaxID=3020898 RepID=A0ABU3KCA8_9BACT|nr:hypothetical protein [Candidatus Nitronereus thalassa]MDT7044062.1 hypothetical protein [Candidatus Nitronereus thalassa]